jgi:hypothetical protein
LNGTSEPTADDLLQVRTPILSLPVVGVVQVAIHDAPRVIVRLMKRVAKKDSETPIRPALSDDVSRLQFGANDRLQLWAELCCRFSVVGHAVQRRSCADAGAAQPRRAPKTQLWAVRSNAVLDDTETVSEGTLCMTKPLPL